MLERLSSLKFGEAELAFQTPSPEAEAPEVEAAGKIASIGIGVFFTAEGIKNLVRESGRISPNEKILTPLLIFSTQKQKTWLVFSDTKVFCLLDDENTRSTTMGSR